jgi:hypothetical protein
MLGRVETLAAVGMVVGLVTVSPARATDYSAAGPLTVTRSNLGSTEGGSIGGYVVVPDGAGPYPLIVASHGWSADADQQVGWGKQFASWGFVVVAPSFPSTLTPDDQTDATIIETLAKSYADPTYTSAAQGKVEPGRLGLEGHSAGGLATTLASAAIHPQATVLFDPVDSNSDGQKALATLCNPLLGAFANPSSCNDNEAWWPYAGSSPGTQVLFHVVDSTHCDGENASRSLCGAVCGGVADTTRQAEYARYATAFFLAELAGDTAAAASLDLGALSADTAITSVSVRATSTCTSAPIDAGNPGPGYDAGNGEPDAYAPPPTGRDAGSENIDAAQGWDGSTRTASGSSSDSSGDGSPSSNRGCSCRSSRGEGDSTVAFGLAAGLASMARLRRRTSRAKA